MGELPGDDILDPLLWSFAVAFVLFTLLKRASLQQCDKVAGKLVQLIAGWGHVSLQTDGDHADDTPPQNAGAAITVLRSRTGARLPMRTRAGRGAKGFREFVRSVV
jgi:hypothetical protein